MLLRLYTSTAFDSHAIRHVTCQHNVRHNKSVVSRHSHQGLRQNFSSLPSLLFQVVNRQSDYLLGHIDKCVRTCLVKSFSITFKSSLNPRISEMNLLNIRPNLSLPTSERHYVSWSVTDNVLDRFNRLNLVSLTSLLHDRNVQKARILSWTRSRHVVFPFFTYVLYDEILYYNLSFRVLVFLCLSNIPRSVLIIRLYYFLSSSLSWVLESSRYETSPVLSFTFILNYVLRIEINYLLLSVTSPRFLHVSYRILKNSSRSSDA